MASTRWVGVGLFFGAVMLLGPASPAGAGIEKGNCNGTGQWVGTDLFIDARTAGDTVFEVPREGDVEWTGRVGNPPGIYDGFIAVDLPPPFGSVTIDTWDGDSDTLGNEGLEEYKLPSLVPAGVEFKVFGEHRDEGNGVCTGYVLMKIEGGPFDSPLTPISLGGTVVTGVGTAAVLRPLFRRK